MSSEAAQQDRAEDAAPRLSFAARHRDLLLGLLAVVLFFAAWQAVFLVVPFNKLFISKPDLIALGLLDLIKSGALFRDLAVSAVPFAYGLAAATVVGVTLGIVMGWRRRVGYALDPLMTVFYASPLVALAPLIVVFFGVGFAAKTLIIFFLAVFPFVFNAYAGVRAVDPLLINVVRSLGGREIDLYLKVLVPSVLPFVVARSVGTWLVWLRGRSISRPAVRLTSRPQAHRRRRRCHRSCRPAGSSRWSCPLRCRARPRPGHPRTRRT